MTHRSATNPKIRSHGEQDEKIYRNDCSGIWFRWQAHLTAAGQGPNVPFYDKELVTLAAKESGFTEEFVRQMDQKKNPSFLFNLYMTSQELSASEQVFFAQSKAIRKIAQQSCVIVGICADDVLRGQPM